jgi:hypothetical protein
MPMIKFQCNNPDCTNEIIKLFVKLKDIAPFLDCGQCGTGKLERQLSAPSSKSTQMIDNGTQARRVEVMDVIIEQETNKLYRKD